MKSTFDLLGIPDQIAAILFTLSLILSLAPYFSGIDFGVVKIPLLDESIRRRLRVVGPIFLIAMLGMFAPFWSKPVAPVEEVDQVAKEIVAAEAKLRGFAGLDDIIKQLKDLRTEYTAAREAIFSDAPDRVAEQSISLLSQLEAFELTDREQRLADGARSKSDQTFNIFPEEVYNKVCQLGESLVARRNNLQTTLESLKLKETDLLRRDHRARPSSQE